MLCCVYFRQCNQYRTFCSFMDTSAASVILIVCTKRTGNKHPGTQERAIFVETECLSFIGSAQPLESQEYKKWFGAWTLTAALCRFSLNKQKKCLNCILYWLPVGTMDQREKSLLPGSQLKKHSSSEMLFVSLFLFADPLFSYCLRGFSSSSMSHF